MSNCSFSNATRTRVRERSSPHRLCFARCTSWWRRGRCCGGITKRWADGRSKVCKIELVLNILCRDWEIGLNLPHLLGMRVSSREYLWICVHVVCFMYGYLLRAQILRRASGKSPWRCSQLAWPGCCAPPQRITRTSRSGHDSCWCVETNTSVAPYWFQSRSSLLRIVVRQTSVWYSDLEITTFTRGIHEAVGTLFFHWLNSLFPTGNTAASSKAIWKFLCSLSHALSRARALSLARMLPLACARCLSCMCAPSLPLSIYTHTHTQWR